MPRTIAQPPQDAEIGVTRGATVESTTDRSAWFRYGGLGVIVLGLLAGLTTYLVYTFDGKPTEWLMPLIVALPLVLVGAGLMAFPSLRSRGAASPAASQPTQNETVVTRVPPGQYLEGHELDCVRQHRFVKFREFWQPLLPGTLVLLLGLLASGVLWVLRVDSWLTLTVFGLLVVVAVVLYLPFGPKWLYLPTEENIPKKAWASLQAFRQGERARKVFWTQLFTALAQIEAYFQIPGFRMRIYAANYKGTAGKTLLLLYIGSLIKVTTGVITTLISATKDRDTSSPGRHAGINTEDPKVLHHTQFTELNRPTTNAFARPDDFQAALAKNQHGVLVIVEDLPKDDDPAHELPEDHESADKEANPYPPGDFDRDVETVDFHSVASLYDGNNNSSDRGTIPEIAARRATVIMPVGNADSIINLEGMRGTVERYLPRRAPIPQAPGEPLRDGRHRPTRSKIIEDAVFAITNVDENDTRDFTTYTKGYGSHTAIVHHDPYMHNEGTDSVNPVNLNRIQLQTLLEIAQLTVHLCRVTADTLGLGHRHIDNMVVTEGYHPQLQLVDSAGRFVSPDTTPTERVETEPAGSAQPNTTDEVPKETFEAVTPEKKPAPAEAPAAAPAKATQNGTTNGVSPEYAALPIPTVSLVGAGQPPEGGNAS